MKRLWVHRPSGQCVKSLRGEGASIQCPGGPRIDASSTKDANNPRCSLALRVTCCAASTNGGLTRGSNSDCDDPHKSQWVCGNAASASPCSPLEKLETPHNPPSLPVRTSSASSALGASNAEASAKKLKNAAIRCHIGTFSLGGFFAYTSKL